MHLCRHRYRFRHSHFHLMDSTNTYTYCMCKQTYTYMYTYAICKTFYLILFFCFRYVRSYRLNLDHSDMILSHIQRCGKWVGDVPTASEFRVGYKAVMESSKKLSSKISVFKNDFDGDDLTVGQGIICPFRRCIRQRGYDDLPFAVTLPLLDLNTDCEIKAKCIFGHISDRLTCVDCMSLLLDNDNFSHSKAQMFAHSCVKPSRFLLDLLKFCESKLKAKYSVSKQQDTEQLIIHIFTDYLCDSLYRTHYMPVNHFLDEPHHIISLMKIIIRTCVNYRQNSLKHLFTVKSKPLN